MAAAACTEKDSEYSSYESGSCSIHGHHQYFDGYIRRKELFPFKSRGKSGILRNSFWTMHKFHWQRPWYIQVDSLVQAIRNRGKKEDLQIKYRLFQPILIANLTKWFLVSGWNKSGQNQNQNQNQNTKKQDYVHVISFPFILPLQNVQLFISHNIVSTL